MSESKLQSIINKDLRDMGVPHFHFEKGRYNKSFIRRKGLSDLLIFGLKGTIFIELKKDEKEKLKPDQIIFKEKIEKYCYPYYQVHNLEQWEFIKEFHKIKRL